MFLWIPGRVYLYVQNVSDIIIRPNKNKKHLFDQLDPMNFRCEATKHAPVVSAFVDYSIPWAESNSAAVELQKTALDAAGS